MQRDREVRGNSNPFDSLGGFGFRGSMFPSMFGGNDPFDDPFFTRPFGSVFGSNMFSSGSPSNLQHSSRPKGLLIQELDSDDEEMPEAEEEGGATDAANRNPLVEHPEDQSSDHGMNDSNNQKVSYITDHNKVEGRQPQTRSVSFQKVTYGGVDGAYYTATTTRKTGNDGVTLEESKQADKTTGQAAHWVSRGIHDKGHSVMRKLDSDGKVDTTQTLHNLNEDELSGFEQAWRGNADRQFHGWNDKFNFHESSDGSGSRHGLLTAREGFADPFREHFNRTRGPSVDPSFQAQSSRGRPKKVVRINID
ncbi:hypothetical protein BUALT_Bualt01G0210000 [Buddleja alternifolia]|uniref:Myeloid leukemia factor 1 n=1 Tax=Buddleja alternifolia TaxID=168488 RepID=A0AAV6Y8V1_9LAMI|nr:hypothetical protein BUALT_Bualt01G0210000 [Buddleja alternifolia]